MNYLYAFLVGGLICAIAQVLIDKTALTPARIVVIFVTAGVVLTALGVYEPLVEFAGAGATVPLTGFGYSLARGVKSAVASGGLLGADCSQRQGAVGCCRRRYCRGGCVRLVFCLDF